MDTLLDIVGITKSYGTTRVLDGVDLAVGRGEVVGIVGENGAGKTTLMSILAGHQQADGGTMRLNGAPYWPKSSEDAQSRGVGIIEQNFSLDPALTVARAIFRNTYQADRPQRALTRPAQWLLDESGVRLSPDAPLGDLAHAEQGLVEAVRLLAEDAQLVIMDEVAAALNVHEMDQLHFIISRLTRQGRSVLYVSHRLREVQAVSTSIAVVRDGRIPERLDPRGVTTNEIAAHMRTRSARRAWFPDRLDDEYTEAGHQPPTVGSPALSEGAPVAPPSPVPAPSTLPTPTADEAFGAATEVFGARIGTEPIRTSTDSPAPAAAPSSARGRRAMMADDGRDYDASSGDAPLLEIEGLDAPGPSGHGVHDVSFTVRAGEIVGLMGPRHAGQEAIVAALNGRAPGRFRTLRINGYNRTIASPEAAASMRIAHLSGPDEESPQERQRSLARAMMAGGWTEGADFDAEVEGLTQMMSALETLQNATKKLRGRRARRAGAPEIDSAKLSGGQQQMVLLGDWMTQDADVLIVTDPSRGLDHDARAAMREKLNEAAENGAAVLLVSSDIDELARSCQRVLVFKGGALAQVVEGSPITHEQLMSAFAGQG